MDKFAGWLRAITGCMPAAPGHITNEQILLVLDGEVGERERRRVERHLTSCWDCRFRSEEMQKAIHQMVECRNLVLDARLKPEPPSGRTLLAARLEQQRASFREQSPAAWMVFFQGRGGVAVLAMSLAILVLVPVLVFHRGVPRAQVATQPPSAQETLQRALSMENADRVPAGHARHRSLTLHIRNKTTSVDFAPRRIELWDTGSRSRRMDALLPGEKVDNGLIASLQELRVSAFGKLATDAARLSVVRDSNRTTLTYRPETGVAARPALLLASLDLRTNDLHPVSGQFDIADDRSTYEYRLSEDSEVELPLADVPAGVFDAPHGARASVEGDAQPSSAASVSNIIDLLAVLDGAGALTQQDVQLQQEANGTLQVSGVVQDELRRQALLQLLQPGQRRGVTVRIATVAEQHMRIRKSVPTLVAVESPADGGADAALMDYLTETLHLSSAEAERRRLQLENQLVAWSSDAESQAEALHEVLTLVPQSKTALASAQVRLEWEALVQHHAAALRTDLVNIEKAIQPLASTEGGAGCRAMAQAPAADARDLLLATRRISGSVANFAASSGADASSAILAPSFGCLLKATEEHALRVWSPPPEH